MTEPVNHTRHCRVKNNSTITVKLPILSYTELGVFVIKAKVVKIKVSLRTEEWNGRRIHVYYDRARIVPDLGYNPYYGETNEKHSHKIHIITRILVSACCYVDFVISELENNITVRSVQRILV